MTGLRLTRSDVTDSTLQLQGSRDRFVIARTNRDYLCRMAVRVRKEAEVSRTTAVGGQPFQHIQPFLVQALRVQRLLVLCYVVANGCRRVLDV